MTLQVPFEQFGASAKRVLGVREAFVTRHVSGSLVTAGTTTARMIVASVAPVPPAEARIKLKESGMEIHEGAWSTEGLTDLGESCFVEAFVSAVSYFTDGGKPGLWVDAFPELPTQIQVLRAMYDEFKDTGESSHVPFEEFVRLANANVIVITPTQMRGFLSRKITPITS